MSRRMSHRMSHANNNTGLVVEEEQSLLHVVHRALDGVPLLNEAGGVVRALSFPCLERVLTPHTHTKKITQKNNNHTYKVKN